MWCRYILLRTVRVGRNTISLNAQHALSMFTNHEKSLHGDTEMLFGEKLKCTLPSTPLQQCCQSHPLEKAGDRLPVQLKSHDRHLMGWTLEVFLQKNLVSSWKLWGLYTCTALEEAGSRKHCETPAKGSQPAGLSHSNALECILLCCRRSSSTFSSFLLISIVET